MDHVLEQVLDARAGLCVTVAGARQTTDSDSGGFELVGVEKALREQRAGLELLENVEEFAWAVAVGQVGYVGENLAQEIQKSAVLEDAAVAILAADGDTVVVESAENIAWAYALGFAAALALVVAELASWLAPA